MATNAPPPKTLEMTTNLLMVRAITFTVIIAGNSGTCRFFGVLVPLLSEVAWTMKIAYV